MSATRDYLFCVIKEIAFFSKGKYNENHLRNENIFALFVLVQSYLYKYLYIPTFANNKIALKIGKDMLV